MSVSKSVKKRLLAASILSAIMVGEGSMAQSLRGEKHEQKAIKKEIRANKKKIQKLKRKLSKNNSKRLKKALRLAKQNHWQLKQRLEDGRLVELVDIDEFGHPMYYTSYNLDAAGAINTINVWVYGDEDLGLTLSGQGITIGEWDGGAVRSTHEEFTHISSSDPDTAYEILPSVSRVIQKDTPFEISNHATHVAGTMIAAGVYFDARGMAPQAKIHAYDWLADEKEMLEEAEQGLLVSNHSYGFVIGWQVDSKGNWRWGGDTRFSSEEDFRFGWYNLNSANWDEIAEAAPHYLMVKAAGNDRGDGPDVLALGQPARDCEFDGFDCIGPQGISKNILTIGVVEDIAAYQGPSSVKAASFSSFGPADDGRIKPDLVANGVEVLSTHGTQADDLYYRTSGTSMAAPSVTGSLALLQEHYHNLNDHYMLATSLKGVAIHTASEAGEHEGPDYKFGWGLMNTKEAATLLSNAHRDAANGLTKGALLMELSLDQGETLTLDLQAETTDKPLEATLVWSDIPAEAELYKPHDNRTPHLINDLDMVIIETTASGEVKYEPYKLDPIHPAKAAVRGDNDVDNVEKIVIQQPTVGSTYQLSVAFDPDQADSNTAESFSLMATNTVSPSCFAPENIQVQEVETNQKSITVTWDKPIFLDGEVFVSYRPKSANNWTEVKASNSESHRLTGLVPGAEYEIRSHFTCGRGLSLYSTIVSEQTTL